MTSRMDAQNAALAHPAPLKPERRVVFRLLPPVAEAEDDAVCWLGIELFDRDARRVGCDGERCVLAVAVERSRRQLEKP